MKARIIGGILYFIVYLFALITDFHLILFPTFLVIGLYEIYQLQKTTNQKSYVVIYTVMFVIGMLTLTYLARVNPGVTFLISLLIMLNDTMALFVGKLIGKHKLSDISPNKTVEGSLGGIIFGSIGSIIIIYYSELIATKFNISFALNLLSGVSYFEGKVPQLLLAAIIITILGQIGDLMESKLKRMCNQKDSGNIIYGHGGILDRVDSLVLAVIFGAIITI